MLTENYRTRVDYEEFEITCRIVDAYTSLTSKTKVSRSYDSLRRDRCLRVH